MTGFFGVSPPPSDMNHRVRAALAVPETYVLALAVWYVTLLSLGIPTLPGWAHVLGALTFGGALLGVVLATARLDYGAVRRTLVRLTGLFVASVTISSVVTATTSLTIKSFMKSTFTGKLLVAVVGACLFGGLAIGLVTAGGAVLRR